MPETYIIAAVRTPIGKFGGALVDVSPVDLGAHVMAAALARAGVAPTDLDLYIFGNILKHGHGQLLPRQAALRAGIPETVDGYAVDMLCSSGMMAVINADQAIRSGQAEVVLAGGIESMSQAGFLVGHRARWGYRLVTGGQAALADVLVDDGLRDPTTQELMGEEADRLARTLGVARGELDEVAARSQARAAAASAAGKFAAELAPLHLEQGRTPITLAQDEGIRGDTNLEGLARLRPAFAQDGLLTAGNSSQLSDGAAALVLASGAAVERLGLRPLAQLLGGAWAAVTPWRFVEGPIPAIHKLLARLDLTLDAFDLFENNEAFALNSVVLRRELEISYDQLNIYGGAIALGHPVGASGARILATLVHALRQEGGRRGLAALCHGLGGGTAAAVEIVD
jgi:acetyl-CoA C-acetyltransferase